MYESWKTIVRCAVGVTENFKVEVGLHQGSALDPFFFESPWTMMFVDGILICRENREKVEDKLER